MECVITAWKARLNNVSINEAKNRVRLYANNKRWAESKGYKLSPSCKEKQALKLLGFGEGAEHIFYRIRWQRKDRTVKELKYMHEYPTIERAIRAIKNLKKLDEFENMELFKCIEIEEKMKYEIE